MKKSPSIKITLKLFKNKKRVYSSTSAKRQLILSRLRTRNFQNGYLKVSYGNGFFNDTENPTDKKTLLWALTNFTEADLIKEIQNFEK